MSKVKYAIISGLLMLGLITMIPVIGDGVSLSVNEEEVQPQSSQNKSQARQQEAEAEESQSGVSVDVPAVDVQLGGFCCRHQQYRYSPYYTYSPFRKHQTSPFKDYSTDYQNYYMYHNYNQGW